MSTSIKLTENNFELPELIHYTKDEDVILGIRLFNLTLAKKVMKQILKNQQIVNRTRQKIIYLQESKDPYRYDIPNQVIIELLEEILGENK